MSTMKWVQITSGGSWKPAIGGELVGVYGGISQVQPRSGDSFYVASIRTPTGVVTTIGGMGLLSLLRDAGVRPGMVIRVIYRGEEAGGDARYAKKLYDLFIQVAEPPAEEAKPVTASKKAKT